MLLLHRMSNSYPCRASPHPLQVRFSKLRGTAICKSTIYREDIFEHADDYYIPGIANVEHTDRAGYVFGFVADFKKRKPGVPYADIQQEPRDVVSLYVHLHYLSRRMLSVPAKCASVRP